MSSHAKPRSAKGRLEATASNEAISRDVERALRGSSHCGLHSIRCKFSDGSAALRGEVTSYYLKQVAQTIAGRLPHVKQVNNELRVIGIESRRIES